MWEIIGWILGAVVAVYIIVAEVILLITNSEGKKLKFKDHLSFLLHFPFTFIKSKKPKI